MQIRRHQPIAHAANLRHTAPPTTASASNVPTEEVQLSVPSSAAAEAGRSSGIAGMAKTAAMVGLALTGVSLLAGCDGAPADAKLHYNWLSGKFEYR